MEWLVQVSRGGGCSSLTTTHGTGASAVVAIIVLVRRVVFIVVMFCCFQFRGLATAAFRPHVRGGFMTGFGALAVRVLILICSHCILHLTENLMEHSSTL